ncbi:putative UPF0481 protein At3g02645 [Momordica charantia]|uniref:UPF0481 protein At3g02645 n=1 Tax=Momordica charantia TaxID=3673 RepID=A0A6J1D655_MOMCH|nr:putative UPF0481 protein At3g02645 [Momordica charantia]
MAIDPDSYTPQEVAIGPYHYWRQELYEMERYKIAAAKRAQKQLQSPKFHNIVEKLTKYERKIRSCYHKYLNFNSETLSWMMAIDASFLLEILRVYTIREEKNLSRVSSKLSNLVDYEGWKSAYNAILRDIVMLENQIPLFVMRKMLELQFSALEPAADQKLLSMLLGLYEDLSPFKVMEDLVNIQASVSECFHLLDFLYRMITPKLADPLEIMEDDQNQKEPTRENIESALKHLFSPLSKLGSEIWKILSKLNRGPVHLLRRLLSSRPLQVIFKLPWTVISKLPGIGILIKPLEHLCLQRRGKEENDPEKGSSRSDGKPRPPLLEEITIPSVSQLVKSGVCLLPIDGGVSAVAFDTKAVIFYLPTITLDVNSEVVLRNLVAYEASKPFGPLVFTRFIELMNGIIDSEEDVKLLKEKGIIMNHLKSDAEVAELWNGMSKSIKLTKVPFLDKVIEDVNKHYSSRWKVKAVKFIEKYVFGSWPLLALLATILLLAMTALQAFCSVYTCSQVFYHLNTART